MVSVGFPQKSTFATLRATKIYCADIDTVAGGLVLSSAGVQNLALTTNRTAFSQDIKLGSNKGIRDAGDGIVFGTDNVGNIDDLAPITDATGVRTAIVNSPTVDLELQKAGTTRLALEGATMKATADFVLGAGRGIQDNSNTVILGTDDAAHIDELARIDAAVKAPATSHYILSSVGTLTTPVQSGTIDEIKGYWHTDADDILYLFLGQMFGRLALGGQVHIDSIKVAYKTEHNDAYVDFARLYRDSLIGVSTVLVGDNSVNNGDGNTDQAVLTVSVDAAVVANYQYKMEIKAEATAGIVRIYGIEVTYHTT